MQSQPGDQWKNGAAVVDCTWATPGSSSVHGAAAMRALKYWGALLGFACISRNNPEDPFCSTSCSMELIGVRMICPQLKEDGFGSESVTIGIDGDTKTLAEVKRHYPKVNPRICSGIKKSITHNTPMYTLVYPYITHNLITPMYPYTSTPIHQTLIIVYKTSE